MARAIGPRGSGTSGGFLVQYKGEVVRLSHLTSNVFEIVLKPDRPMAFRPGQYLSVVVPVEDGRPLRRPYSIASPPENDLIELCVQKIEKGPGSGYLASLSEGDTIEWFGPYGYLTYEGKAEREALFVATGTGIAPFRSMLLSEEYRAVPPREVRVLLGVRTHPDILYPELSEVASLRWVPCLSQSGEHTETYFAGRVTDYLRHHDRELDWANTEFYLCGNGAMIDEVKRYLKERGVDRTAIHQEIYFRPPKENVK